jgi:hypothetical protein
MDPPVGAELARDSGLSSDIIVVRHTAIASKLGSYNIRGNKKAPIREP